MPTAPNTYRGGPCAYTLDTDGVQVWATPNSQTQLSSVFGTCTGDVMQQCITALAPYGGTIMAQRGGGAGVYPFTTVVPKVPVGLINPIVITSEYGAVFRMSTTAPRFLDFTTTAPYQSLENFVVHDLIIDGNSITGNGSLIGSFGGAGLDRANVRKMRFENLTFRNVVTDQSAIGTKVSQRFGIWIYVYHPTGTTTQTEIRDIVARGIRQEGGNFCVGIGGQAQVYTETALLVYLDNIALEKNWHDCYNGHAADIPTQIASTGSYQIAGQAYGDTGHITDCFAGHASDTGYELNAMQNMEVGGCVAENSLYQGFTHTNFRPPPEREAQTIVFRDSIARRRGAYLDGVAYAPGVSDGGGFFAVENNSIPLGRLIYRGCSYHKRGDDVKNYTRGLLINGPALRELIVDDFNCVIEGGTLSSGTVDAVPYYIMIGSAAGVYPRVTLRNLRLRYQATRTGTGAIILSGIVIMGPNPNTGERVWFDLDNPGLEMNVTGAGAGSQRYISIGGYSGAAVQSRLEGIIRGAKGLLATDPSAKGIEIHGSATLLIDGKIQIRDYDFLGLGGAAISYAGTSNAAKVAASSGWP